MKVLLRDKKYFEIITDSSNFIPTVNEIYAVIFEGKTDIRGHSISRDKFMECGISFSEFQPDLKIILESQTGTDQPNIFCKLMAQSGPNESSLAQIENLWLGYAILDRVWSPLALGAEAEAETFLSGLGISLFSPVSLSGYMKLVRLEKSVIPIEDRTQHALSALSLSSSLSGELPKGFTGKLYDYQKDGFHWLSFMVRNNLGVIIADEMGLGKTVQVICLLLELKAQNKSPHLVVAPATLLENWRRELLKFAPDLKVLIHCGSRRTGYSGVLAEQDIIICSYDTVVADIALFRTVPWRVVILDEAQNIKNPEARRTLKLKTIPRDVAIAVTGTPVENYLKDLWSLTDFVLPSFLGSLDTFESRFSDTSSGAAKLENAISPIILRRRVNEVAQDLPERIEIPQALELSEDEILAYESIRVAHQISSGGGLAALTKLRMFCTHPWLADSLIQYQDPLECSVKFRRLFEIMEEIIANNGKALVFTSYSESIDLIKTQILSRFGIFVDYIDGRVPVADRQKKVDLFTSHNGSALLVLNPKAAGVGLNITAANYVVHFNLEWNPAVEDQASARAHRRGQTKTVMIYRLFYANTVEEIVNDRMEHKRELAEIAVSGTDGKDQELNDLMRALSISPARN